MTSYGCTLNSERGAQKEEVYDCASWIRSSAFVGREMYASSEPSNNIAHTHINRQKPFGGT
eukprot:scaffold29271_cov16-Tisochrysis_lutea.AAC.1